MLESGRSLMHYRLVEKIGEGGMGVVWKALDTTLSREVAVKVLPQGFAGDSERLARFEREAKLLASLNHPNIAGIFGIHSADGHTFLAMELIVGEDLQQRLSRGALSRDEALRVGLQIAQAFEVAHESGVIHRDLKPANVKLTASGQVKVLDFGLAKALAQDPSNPTASPSMSPTLTSTGSVVGMLLGTAAYMSPEQAKGKPVDRRADIWSFGVVLLELLSGRRVFEGETISETLAAVIMKEVDLDGLPGDTPPQVRRLLERCLERNPDKRLRDIGEARIRLEEAIASPRSVAPTTATMPQRKSATRFLPWTIAAIALAALGWSVFDRPTPAAPPPVMRFTMSIADDQPLASRPLPMLAISRDGKRIAYMSQSRERRTMLIRHSDQYEATSLKGAEDASTPFFSPDGEWLGFEADGKLKKISVLGGPPTTLCNAPRLRGASWGSDGTIVFTPDRAGGLMRVSESGGEPEPLTDLQVADKMGSPSHRWPEFLPDGRTVLYTASDNHGNYTDAKIVALSLSDRSSKTLIEGGTFARFVAPGFLVYARNDTLFAARFDPERVELTGPAVPVLEGVSTAASFGSAQLTVSSHGTLLYLAGSLFAGAERLVWLDREGKETPASVHERDFGAASLSPDGKRVALEVISEADGTNDLWLLELARDTMTRLTFDDTRDIDPIWTPDGKWLTYTSDGGDGSAGMNLFRRRADGTGVAERLTSAPGVQRAISWSPDGSVLAFVEDSGDTGADLMLYRPGGEPEVELFLRTPFDEWGPHISPDGRWVLFGSNQSGRPEIYVRSLTGEGQQVRISTEGSGSARWSPDGNQLFYSSITDKMMAVRYTVEDGAFVPSLPVELFDLPTPPYSFYFETVRGGRFLFYRDIDEDSAPREPMVVINWERELEAKVPRAK